MADLNKVFLTILGIIFVIVIVLGLAPSVQNQVDESRLQGATEVVNESINNTNTSNKIALAFGNVINVTQLMNTSGALLTETTHFTVAGDGITFTAGCACNNSIQNVTYNYRTSDLSDGADDVISIMPLLFAAFVVVLGIAVLMGRKKQ